MVTINFLFQLNNPDLLWNYRGVNFLRKKIISSLCSMNIYALTGNLIFLRVHFIMPAPQKKIFPEVLPVKNKNNNLK